MTKAIGILLVLAMFALSGCASSGESFGARDVNKASLAAPACISGTEVAPWGGAEKKTPPYHW